ncbi:unnamed protein product [Sphagnum balticum]
MMVIGGKSKYSTVKGRGRKPRHTATDNQQTRSPEAEGPIKLDKFKFPCTRPHPLEGAPADPGLPIAYVRSPWVRPVWLSRCCDRTGGRFGDCLYLLNEADTPRR